MKRGFVEVEPYWETGFGGGGEYLPDDAPGKNQWSVRKVLPL